MDDNTWNTIPNFENYEISIHGVVRRIKSKRVKKPRTHVGYFNIRLHKGSKSFQIQLHRILAIVFIPNPHNKEYVNHKDGNRSNNSLENLEWCTQKENVYHSKNILRHGAVISYKKIKEVYETYPKNGNVHDFVNILLRICK